MSTYLPAYIWTTDKFNSHTHRGERNTKSKAKLIQLALKALKHTHIYTRRKEAGPLLYLIYNANRKFLTGPRPFAFSVIYCRGKNFLMKNSF